MCMFFYSVFKLNKITSDSFKNKSWIARSFSLSLYLFYVRLYIASLSSRSGTDPSWGGPIELFLVPASAPRLV